VGAASYYLEREGLPTTGISLVRENTVAMRPPRALWVPFELGRPLGVPGDPAFQMRVVKAALALLERSGGPVILEDYPEDAPALAETADDMDGLVCPWRPPKPEHKPGGTLAERLAAEMAGLAPWYDMARSSRGRTTVGVSGLDMPEVVEFLLGLADERPENPRAGHMTLGECLRFATEDLRVWYLEAAGARPGIQARSSDLADWFWGETAAGELLLALHPICSRSSEPTLARVASTQLVPRSQRHRLSAG